MTWAPHTLNPLDTRYLRATAVAIESKNCDMARVAADLGGGVDKLAVDTSELAARIRTFREKIKSGNFGDLLNLVVESAPAGPTDLMANLLASASLPALARMR